MWSKANAVKEAQKERAAAAREQKKSPQGASFSSQRNDHVFFGPHRNHWRGNMEIKDECGFTPSFGRPNLAAWIR